MGSYFTKATLKAWNDEMIFTVLRNNHSAQHDTLLQSINPLYGQIKTLSDIKGLKTFIPPTPFFKEVSKEIFSNQ